MDMKKSLAIILLLALSLPAFSQTQSEQKWTVRASAAYYPSVPLVLLPFIGIGVGLGADKDAGETSKLVFPPYASIEALYSFNERWSVGLDAGYCGIGGGVYNADGTIKSKINLTILPIGIVGRCNYLNRPVVKLYGSLEAGAMLVLQDDFQVVPEVQLNPIGIEFGRRFFGLLEAGFGFNYAGLRAGVGYRF